MTEHTVLPLKANPGMPPRQPLDMPVQNLQRAPARRHVLPTPRKVRFARLVTFGGAALLAAFGTYEMTEVVSVGGITVLEGVMTAIFALTFSWIALAATSALAGAFCSPARHVRLVDTGGRLTTRTALVMPIYHEDPTRTTAALEAMAKGLQAAGEADAFEIVVLSDSTNADSWIGETHLRRPPRERAARRSCRSGIAAAGRTPRRRRATSRTSSSNGAAATTTSSCSTPTA